MILDRVTITGADDIVKAIESAPAMATEEGAKVRDEAIGNVATAFKGLRVFCGIE